MTRPDLKYFLKHGLEDVKDLPEKAISQMRIALALNWLDKDKFIESMKGSGVQADKLASIFEDQVHLSTEMANLEVARQTGMKSKVWVAGQGCRDCAGLNGVSVPIDRPFPQKNTQVAHGHSGCSCSTIYKKGPIETPGEKIFTKGEIAEMSKAEYETNRSQILEQYASGLIK